MKRAVLMACLMTVVITRASAETWIEGAEDQLTCTSTARKGEREQFGAVLMPRPYSREVDEYFYLSPRSPEHARMRYLTTLAVLAWSADRTNDQKLVTELYLRIRNLAQRYAGTDAESIFGHISRCARARLISSVIESDNPADAVLVAYDLAQRYEGHVPAGSAFDWPLILAMRELTHSPETKAGLQWLLSAAVKRANGLEAAELAQASRLHHEIARAFVFLGELDRADKALGAALKSALGTGEAAVLHAIVPTVFDLWTQIYGMKKGIDIVEALLMRYPKTASLADPAAEFAFHMMQVRIATEQDRVADAQIAATAAKDSAVDRRGHRMSLPFLRQAYSDLFRAAHAYNDKGGNAVIAQYGDDAAAGKRELARRLVANETSAYQRWAQESQRLFAANARDQLFNGERLDGLLDTQFDVTQLAPEETNLMAARSLELAQVRTFGRLTLATASSAVSSLRLDENGLRDVENFFNLSTQNSVWLRSIRRRWLTPSSDEPPSGDKLKEAITLLGGMYRQTGVNFNQQVARVRSLAPELSALITPQPTPAAEFQGLLQTDESLVATVVAGDALYVWGVTRDKIIFRRVPLSAAEVRNLARRVRVSIAPKQSNGLVQELPPFDAGAAHELYRVTFGVVEPVLKNAKHVFWYGHEALGSVPPAILVTAAPVHEQIRDPAELAKTPFLLDRFAVSVLADLSLFAYHRSRQVSSARAAKTFLGIGAPLLTIGELDVVAPRSRSYELAGGQDIQQLSQLPKLAESVDELKALAGILGAKDSTLWLGPNAGERRFVADGLLGFQVIALATHGFLSGEVRGLSEPALLLALPSEPDGRFDGILTSQEIASLRLDADLVILSACNTASADGRPRAETFTGLTQAFFTAGARSLMVSHWPVMSGAAVQLSVGTVERSRNDGLPLARSLQLTMQAVRKAGTSSAIEAHPSYWGPFIIVGDGQRSLRP